MYKEGDGLSEKVCHKGTNRGVGTLKSIVYWILQWRYLFERTTKMGFGNKERDNKRSSRRMKQTTIIVVNINKRNR